MEVGNQKWKLSSFFISGVTTAVWLLHEKKLYSLPEKELQIQDPSKRMGRI